MIALRGEIHVACFHQRVFLGWLGLDRFMMGSWIVGLIKLLTWGLFGILWLIDLFILPLARGR